MTQFAAYARYYDLVYRDKDYGSETAFVHALIQRHAPAARRVLELGCGTGLHGVLLAERGYTVVGLDISAEMLEAAARRVAALPPASAERVKFFQGDVRTFETEGQYDAILALFHVISYQVSNTDLHAVFSRVKNYLAPDGVFIFDCWYGPAVLTDRPTVRVKRLADDATTVIRIAEPSLHSNENVVDVNYNLFVTDRASGDVAELTELHRMRYLFRPELDLLAEQHGLRIVDSGAWMSDRPTDDSSWYVHFALKHAC